MSIGRTLLIAILSVSLSGWFNSASAQASDLQPYLGVDAFLWDLELDGNSEFSDVGVRFRGGVHFTPQIAFEAHVGLGGSDRQSFVDEDGPFSVEASVDRLIGGYLRANIPVADTINLYALVGYTDLRLDLTLREPGFSITESDNISGPSFGIGLEGLIFDNTYVTFDYINYLNKPNTDLTAFSLGLRWVF
jgi:hypothetical protein